MFSPNGRRARVYRGNIMALSLLTTRRFLPLFSCQFFSAFSDNFLKNALVFLLVFKVGGPLADVLTQIAAAVFIAPYFFLSALGGEMADRFDKAWVAQRLKLAEIGIALDEQHPRLGCEKLCHIAPYFTMAIIGP